MQGRDYVDYFAYGSNMSEEDLSKWCKRHGYPPIKPLEVEVAVLRDFKLVFNYKSESRGCGVANIIPHKGGEVWGLLMRLSPSDYEKIKEKEGCCRVYKEIEVTVVTRSEGRAVKAKTFM
ncbi:MAG: gamma-glutamylcyclotransferase family protein, partial [Acidilobaceae archaeon]